MKYIGNLEARVSIDIAGDEVVFHSFLFSQEDHFGYRTRITDNQWFTDYLKTFLKTFIHSVHVFS